MTDRLPSLPETSIRTRALVIGGVLGLVVGLLAAQLYARAAEENGQESPKIGTMDILRLTIALVAIVRQITEMASQDNK
jgi:hypothetical protein